MKLLSIRTIRGRNIYAHFPVVRMVVDLEGLVDTPTSAMAGFNEALLTLLPGLDQHHCSKGRKGGFVERLKKGTYLAHVMEHIAIELQRMMGYSVSYGKARWNCRGNEYYLVFAYRNEYAGMKAGKLAFALVESLLNNTEFELKPVLSEIKAEADKHEPVAGINALIRHASSRNIPVLNSGTDYVHLGYGRDQIIVQSFCSDENCHLLATRPGEGVDYSQNLYRLQEEDQTVLEILHDHFEDKIQQVPLIAVTGTNGKTTTTRMIASALRAAGHVAGYTSTEGIFLNGRMVASGDTTGPDSAFRLLSQPCLTAAVLETARGGMIRKGLGYDLADVAVVTNIGADHLMLDGIENCDQLASAKALVVEAVKPEGTVVLNAADAYTSYMMSKASGRIVLFSGSEKNPLLQHHLQKGGTGVFLRNRLICIAENNRILPVLSVDYIPATMNGLLQHNTENALACTAAAYSAGVPVEVIRHSLRDFRSDETSNKGRFNCYQYKGVNIVLDYGHNPDGYRKVLDVINLFKDTSRIGVVGVPGDREDEMIREAGKVAAGGFDRIIFKEDEDLRGRLPGEVPRLMLDGINESGGHCFTEYIPDEASALKQALTYAKPGDWVVVFFEKFDKVKGVLNELDGCTPLPMLKIQNESKPSKVSV